MCQDATSLLFRRIRPLVFGKCKTVKFPLSSLSFSLVHKIILFVFPLTQRWMSSQLVSNAASCQSLTLRNSTSAKLSSFSPVSNWQKLSTRQTGLFWSQFGKTVRLRSTASKECTSQQRWCILNSPRSLCMSRSPQWSSATQSSTTLTQTKRWWMDRTNRKNSTETTKTSTTRRLKRTSTTRTFKTARMSLLKQTRTAKLPRLRPTLSFSVTSEWSESTAIMWWSMTQRVLSSDTKSRQAQ